MNIAFTGRRPKDLCGYKLANYQYFTSELVKLLLTLCKTPNEIYTFISGGAQGFDQLSFWAVDILKKQHPELTIHNNVYVPHKGQANVWLPNGLFGQNEYQSMLTTADNVTYLQDVLSSKYQIIKALTDRNHAMVNNADLIVALYPDDSWETSKGGTAECMRYAKSKNKTILQIIYSIDNNILKIKNSKMIT